MNIQAKLQTLIDSSLYKKYLSKYTKEHFEKTETEVEWSRNAKGMEWNAKGDSYTVE